MATSAFLPQVPWTTASLVPEKIEDHKETSNILAASTKEEATIDAVHGEIAQTQLKITSNSPVLD